MPLTTPRAQKYQGFCERARVFCCVYQNLCARARVFCCVPSAQMCALHVRRACAPRVNAHRLRTCTWSNACKRARNSKEAPKRNKDGPKTASRRPQVGPHMPPDGPEKPRDDPSGKAKCAQNTPGEELGEAHKHIYTHIYTHTRATTKKSFRTCTPRSERNYS